MPYANPTRQREAKHEYYLKHKAEVYARIKASRKADPERWKEYRRREKLKPMEAGNEEWYQKIKQGIMAGVSTNALPEVEQDLWWTMFKAKIDYVPVDPKQYRKEYDRNKRKYAKSINSQLPRQPQQEQPEPSPDPEPVCADSGHDLLDAQEPSQWDVS